MQNEIQVSRCWKTETWWDVPWFGGLLRQEALLNTSASDQLEAAN